MSFLWKNTYAKEYLNIFLIKDTFRFVHLEYDPVKKLNATDDRESREKAHVAANLKNSTI